MKTGINKHFKSIFSRNIPFLQKKCKFQYSTDYNIKTPKKSLLDTSNEFYNSHRKKATDFFTGIQNIKIEEKLNEYSLILFKQIFSKSKIEEDKKLENNNINKNIDFSIIKPISKIFNKKIIVKVPCLTSDSKKDKKISKKSKNKKISFENNYIPPFEYTNDIYYKRKYISKVSTVKTTNNFFINKTYKKKCFKDYYLQISSEPELKLSFSKVKMIPKEIIILEEKIKEKENENYNLKNILLNKKNESLNLDLEYEKMFSECQKSEMIRKKAQEYIHSIKGNILVYCRIKPSLNKNEENSIISFPEILTENNLNLTNNILTNIELKNLSMKNSYYFDRIFPENTSQIDIFEEIKPFIQSSLDGENICIFAYGATGSGKTYTMQGKIDENNNNNFIIEQSGILPRTAHFIFEEKNRLEKINENLDVYFSAIEIYNETIYDLLANNNINNNINMNNNNKRIPLTVYCANNEINIPNLQWKNIQNKNDIIKFTLQASNTRSSDSTSFNSVSSRSHAIYRIKIYNNSNKKNSMINIIDLAGSERSSLKNTSNLTKEEKDYIKKIQNEANFINKSLSALGRIINLIGDKKNCNKLVIPYRESKLTIVLQNYLKPNSKTVMIVNVSGENKDYNFTKESLNFATNAMVNC